MSHIGRPIKEDVIKRVVAVPQEPVITPGDRQKKIREWERRAIENAPQPERVPVKVPQKEGA